MKIDSYFPQPKPILLFIHILFLYFIACTLTLLSFLQGKQIVAYSSIVKRDVENTNKLINLLNPKIKR